MAAYRKRRNPPNRLLLTLAVVSACGLAALASFQRPFTFGANLVTAIALVIMLAAQVVCSVRSRAGRASVDPDTAGGPTDHPGLRVYLPWIVLTMAFTALEIVEYLSEPRHAHPTFSSLSDEVTSSQAGRAALFVAWLVLGVLFVERRRRHGVPAHSPSDHRPSSHRQETTSQAADPI